MSFDGFGRKGFVLWMVCFALPAFPESVRIQVDVKNAEARHASSYSVEATLTATPVVGLPGEKLPDSISLQARIPGLIELDLGSGISWKLQAEAPGFWGPSSLFSAVDPPEATLRLFPTAVLLARVETAAGVDKPTAMEVRFRASSRPLLSSGGADEILACPISKNRWRCEIPEGTLDLRLRAKGFVPHYLWERQAKAAQSLDLGTVNLIPGASISGWVMTEDDTPLSAETRIRARPLVARPRSPTEGRRQQSLGAEVELTARGFFQMEGLSAGAFVLSVEEPGFASFRSEPIVVVGDSDTELEHALVLTRPAELWVSLEPAVDADGQAWQLTLVDPSNREKNFSGRTDPTGSWAASAIDPGKYLLMVADSEGSRLASEEIHVEGPLTEHWMALGFVEVEGELFLGEDPLAATVAFGGISGMTSVKMESDEEGRFSGVVPRAGPWPVDVRSESAGVFRRLQAVSVEPLAGTSAARVEILLPDTRLEGEVVDAEGRGVEGAGVMAFPVALEPDDPSEPPSFTRSGPGGSFHFDGFEPALYRLQAVRRVAGKPEPGEAVEVDLPKDDPVQFVRLILARPKVFRGRAFSGSGGVPGASVLARPLGGTRNVLLPDTRTASDGSFELIVPPGSTRLELTIEAPGFLFYQEIVEIPDGTELPLPLAQDRGGTLVIRPQVPIDLASLVGGPGITRGDGMRLALGTLAHWATLSRAPPVGESLEVPQMSPGSYTVCWPARPPAEEPAPQRRECETGHLSSYGRLEFVEGLSESRASEIGE